jgi:hypothetical protein
LLNKKLFNKNARQHIQKGFDIFLPFDGINDCLVAEKEETKRKMRNRHSPRASRKSTIP